MYNHLHIHFPVAILIHNGSFINAAAAAHPEISFRLPADYLTETKSLLGCVIYETARQKTAKGKLGGLTIAQHKSLDVLQHLMNQVRKTARLAFPGQTVKLHQDFQMGDNTQNDIRSLLNQADVMLASLKNLANLRGLKLKGWTGADTRAFEGTRQGFGSAKKYRQTLKSRAKDFITNNTQAVDLYDHLLTIQNAANLQWPATNADNAAVRDEFRLNTFPPSHSAANDTAPAPAPQPPTRPDHTDTTANKPIYDQQATHTVRE